MKHALFIEAEYMGTHFQAWSTEAFFYLFPKAKNSFYQENDN
jgi:hypothetical protein